MLHLPALPDQLTSQSNSSTPPPAGDQGMSRNVLLTAGLALALGTTACQDQDQKSDLTAPAVGTAELRQSRFTRDPSRLKLPASVRVSDLRDPSRAVVPTT